MNAMRWMPPMATGLYPPLVVQTHAGSRVPIFDPHALSTPLALGERYDLVLTLGVARGMHLLSHPAPEPLPARADMLLRVFERAPDTLGFTQAQVLDAHWWIPDACAVHA